MPGHGSVEDTAGIVDSKGFVQSFFKLGWKTVICCPYECEPLPLLPERSAREQDRSIV